MKAQDPEPDPDPEPQFNVPYGSKDPDFSQLSWILNNGNKNLVRDKTARKNEVSMFMVESNVEDPNPVGHEQVQFNFAGSG